MRPDRSRPFTGLRRARTIDALCRRLVKDHALEAGVDPGFAVLEPEAAEMVKDEVMREAWETVVKKPRRLCSEPSLRQGQGLCQEVSLLYDRLRGLGQDEPRVVVDGGQDEDEAWSLLVEVIEEALAAGIAQVRPSAALQADLATLRMAWSGCEVLPPLGPESRVWSRAQASSPVEGVVAWRTHLPRCERRSLAIGARWPKPASGRWWMG